MTATDVREPEAEKENPFGAFAKVFAALAEFFGNPAVQEAGRKLFADLDVDRSYSLPSSGFTGAVPILSPPAELSEGSPEHAAGS